MKIVNGVLGDIREFMEEEAENKYLDMLDDATLPQYSDAILILSQYEGALKGFRECYHSWDSGEHEYMLNIEE